MSTQAGPIAIYWFRRDLRLADLPGLAAAARAGPVLPCYVQDDGEAGAWSPGSASRWWLHHSLAALAQEIAGHGGRLVLLRGDSAQSLADLARSVGASQVHCSLRHEPWAREQQQRVGEALRGCGISLSCHPGSLLFDPEILRNRQDLPFRVFTPFWKECLRRPEPRAAPMPETMPWVHTRAGVRLEDLGLLPTSDWADGWGELWRPGSAGAHASLDGFLDRVIGDYEDGRDHPSRGKTSRLSPHLHFGEISPRQLWEDTAGFRARRPDAERQVGKFLSQLGWREFSCHLLYHFPHITDRPFREEYGAFPWREDPDALEAWKRGRTGYPVVDAGMRELWHTGYMHNRSRMIAASFLTKHLRIPWQSGARWFWDTLVDADLANNSCGWQWTAGSGADAAPYFRVFNPALQGRKFDRDGDYVRRWVPEISALPDRHLHDGAAAPDGVLERCGIVAGRDYPAPIVDHARARQEALAAHASIRRESQARTRP